MLLTMRGKLIPKYLHRNYTLSVFDPYENLLSGILIDPQDLVGDFEKCVVNKNVFKTTEK